MHYLVGLGNPGEKYKNTRHNIGRELLVAWVRHVGMPDFVATKKYVGQVSDGVWSGVEVSALLPDTFMNKSGSAVSKLVPQDAVQNLVVLYDEVDLPLGEVKVSKGRGSGGHNGVESVASALGSKQFTRVRIGVGPTKSAVMETLTGKAKRPAGDQLARFVLKSFSKREQQIIASDVTPRVQQIVGSILTDGPARAMNQFN